MAKLSAQQQAIIDIEGDVFVTACPGSGKTRLLTEKIANVLSSGIPLQCRIAAVTFTNRAADEIRERIQSGETPTKHLWTGTIHSFALEWILRPYGSYDPLLRSGFSVADEYLVRNLVDSLREIHGVGRNTTVRMAFDRQGQLVDASSDTRALILACRKQLATMRLIDFDCLLYRAYRLLKTRAEIPRTLGAIFRLVCIDEYQDTQDLQFGILSEIVRASHDHTRVFLVGDKNQAIYSSLGGIAKTIQEVKDEFGRQSLCHHELSGNYRSTQRIVDFCSRLRDEGHEQIRSLSEYSAEQGLITFDDRTVGRDDLAQTIAALVRYHISNGIKPEDICILGPSWWLLTEIGRQLVLRLPEVDLDAPGLSPLRYQADCLWFQLTRLFLTDPIPSRFRSRMRWSADCVSGLEASLGFELPEDIRSARSFLRIINGIESEQESGLAYLDDVFEQLFERYLEIDVTEYPALSNSRELFFEGAEVRLIEQNNELETVDTLKKMFRHPSGVSINSCHGAKGDEYSVVICFGLLRGYIPHWSRIMDLTVDDPAESRRILYVVASRAKKFIHLFSEDGHRTKGGTAYETTRELAQVDWDYDALPG